MTNLSTAWRPAQASSSRGQRWLLGMMLAALCSALPASPALAADVRLTDQTPVNAPVEIYWLSGGIGDESRDEMQQSAAAYNVHMLFTDRKGEYLADIPVTIATRKGQLLYSAVSEGPMLYLKLPPGSYLISAEIDGAWQKRNVQLDRSGRASRLQFVSRL